MLDFLPDKKTTIGLVIFLLGFFGLADFISENELTTLIDHFLIALGLVLEVYGRIMAHLRK